MSSGDHITFEFKVSKIYRKYYILNIINERQIYMNQNEFIKNLSILDVVANLGWQNTEIYIKSIS